MVRKGVFQLISNLGKKIGNGLEEIITTNGSQLEKTASELYDCGVKRINVSLDHLNEKSLEKLQDGET